MITQKETHQHVLSAIKKAKLKSNPFNHIVIDDFIPEEFGRMLLDDYPNDKHEYWTASESGKAVKNKMYSNKIGSDVLLPDSIQNFIYFLNGGAVCAALEDKFGLGSRFLISDPHLGGGGLHSIGRKGKLEVHADFNYHPSEYLHRRLNLLLYLNYDWDESWGGNIDLWSTDMKQKEVSVPPLGGKCVIFLTDPTSFHGHPYGLRCPENTRRNSIALYYYTQDKDMVPVIEKKRKTTLYQHKKRQLIEPNNEKI